MDEYDYLVVTHVGVAGCAVDTANGQPVPGEDPIEYERGLLADGWQPYECSSDELLALLAGVAWDTTRIREELARENAGAWSVYRRSAA